MKARQSDQGSVTLLFVILAAVFISMALMVVEGGQKLTNISRSQDLAAEAARVGAASLDLEALAQGKPRIDETQANERISEIMSFVNDPTVTWTASVVDLDEQTIEVRVTISEASWIPGFDLEGKALHRASVVDALDALAALSP